MPDLRTAFPWTSFPLVVNAPMAGFAGGRLASAVTLSGGLGMIGSAFSMDELRAQLQIASQALSSHSSFASSSTLAVGVGFLPFIIKLEDALPVIAEFKPAVIWIFAAKQLDDYATWAKEIKRISPTSQIWIQCGSVAAALHLARTASPDVLCLQGADAGGHGFEKGAGIVSLVPETSDALQKAGLGGVTLVASGGIVDGRGVAAALALGAHGVVMGTRFLASSEVIIHPQYRAAILEAQDGGQVTTRSKLFDELKGPNIWPKEYDGRSLAMQSWKDHIDGVSIDEIQRLHNEAVKEDDKGYATALKGRAAIWAGTGVGLVGQVEAAADIVVSVRDEAKGILSRLAL